MSLTSPWQVRNINDKSVTSSRGQKSIVSVVSCRFPNSTTKTCFCANSIMLPNPLHTFPRNFAVDGETCQLAANLLATSRCSGIWEMTRHSRHNGPFTRANLLRTCYGESGVGDFAPLYCDLLWICCATFCATNTQQMEVMKSGLERFFRSAVCCPRFAWHTRRNRRRKNWSRSVTPVSGACVMGITTLSHGRRNRGVSRISIPLEKWKAMKGCHWPPIMNIKWVLFASLQCQNITFKKSV